ncbi:MAG: histidinol dehydrogenase [Chloroflexi bacterium]|nr:histidinol dehydrogenase [Chloroflexota bacterium]
MRIVPLKELPPGEVNALLQRNRAAFEDLLPRVREIVHQVRARGDEALLGFTSAFDRVDLTHLEVTPQERQSARQEVTREVMAALERAITHVEQYHALSLASQQTTRWESLGPGLLAGWVRRPIQRVGLYAPGGRAVYPSSVIMTGAPARLAGCPTRVLCIPPTPDGRAPAATLAAADLVGVQRVFKVGGAQAVAALAYGTETIPAVDKIFGAGNLWVTAAKALVSQDVAIDMPAGPSEVLILADESAPARWVAADLLAQAEHGPDSVCLLVTPSARLAQAVAHEVAQMVGGLATRAADQESLARNGAILLVDSLEEGMDFANRFAAEHLQIIAAEPERWLAGVTQAGSVFLGPWSPVALGDYASGPNHVLPTAGHARAYSALGVEAFTRTIQVQAVTAPGLRRLAPAVAALAQVEGLPAHARAVQVRLEEQP